MTWIAATMDEFRGRYKSKFAAVHEHSYANPPRAVRLPGGYYEAVGTLDHPSRPNGVYIATETVARKAGFRMGPACARSLDHDDETTVRCVDCDVHLCAECRRTHRCGRSDAEQGATT